MTHPAETLRRAADALAAAVSSGKPMPDISALYMAIGEQLDRFRVSFCWACDGGGSLVDGHSNDPDARILKCEECAGEGYDAITLREHDAEVAAGKAEIAASLARTIEMIKHEQSAPLFAGVEPAPCSRESHQARIARDSQWARMTPIGEQVVPAYEDEPAVLVKLANCDLCSSTLGREEVRR